MVRVSLLDFNPAAGAAPAGAVAARTAVAAARAATGVAAAGAGAVGPLVVAGAAPPPHAAMKTASADSTDNFIRREIDLISVNLPSLVSMRPPPLRRPAPVSPDAPAIGAAPRVQTDGSDA